MLLTLLIIYPAHSPNFILHDFRIFGPIKKALKGYTVTPGDNLREVRYSGLDRSPKNSLHSWCADLYEKRGFLSKCLWWIFLIVEIPSSVSILSKVFHMYMTHIMNMITYKQYFHGPTLPVQENKQIMLQQMLMPETGGSKISCLTNLPCKESLWAWLIQDRHIPVTPGWCACGKASAAVSLFSLVLCFARVVSILN